MRKLACMHIALLAVGMEVGDDESLIAQERIFCGESVKWCFESLRVLYWPRAVQWVGAMPD